MLYGHSLKGYHYEKKDMSYAKRNKRHAQESMMKKRRKKRKTMSKKRKRREMVHKRISYTIQKNIHTHAHAHLDQGL
jgi:hypothetical protein